MGEKIGFISVLALVLIFIVPFTLNLFDKQVKANKLMSLNNEIRQMVVAEGGVTPNVEEVVDDFSNMGVKIEFKDDNGKEVIGQVKAGEKVNIELEYDGFETGSTVIITKRK